MDDLFESFSRCGLNEIITPQEIIDEFHQYIENRGFELNYQEKDEDYEKNMNYREALGNLRGFRRWMMEEWFWVFMEWITFHFYGTGYDFTKSPTCRDGIHFTREEYTFFTKSLPFMLHFLWQNEEGRKMYPEEEHSLFIFCEDYYEFHSGRI